MCTLSIDNSDIRSLTSKLRIYPYRMKMDLMHIVNNLALLDINFELNIFKVENKFA